MNFCCFRRLVFVVLALAAGPGMVGLKAEAGVAGASGLRMVDADLEVFVTGLPAGRPATVVLTGAKGGEVLRGAVTEEGPRFGRARLAGALPAFTRSGPVWRLSVVGEGGVALGQELPLLVALDCPPGEACRFELLPGLTAPGAALVDPALGRALDGLPAGTMDLLGTAAADPALRGAALTAAWHWVALPAPPPGICGCAWTVEAALPGGIGDGGVAAGVAACRARREAGRRVEQARSSSLALRRRCVRSEIRSAETVAVAQGAWSGALAVPRVVLTGCPVPCAADISWEAEVEGRARARVEGGLDTSAESSWEAAVTVDGTVVLEVEDEAVAVPGGAGAEALRRAHGGGSGELAGLWATARAGAAAAGDRTADAAALADVAWQLAGSGTSVCAQPERVQVGLTSMSRLQGHTGFEDEFPGCDPGQIGLLIVVKDPP